MKNSLRNILLVGMIVGMCGVFAPTYHSRPGSDTTEAEKILLRDLHTRVTAAGSRAANAAGSAAATAGRSIGLMSQPLSPEEQAKQAEWKPLIQNIEDAIKNAFTIKGRGKYNVLRRVYRNYFNEDRLKECLIVISQIYKNVEDKIKAKSISDEKKEEEINEFTNQLFSKNQVGPIFGLIRNFMYACHFGGSDESFARTSGLFNSKNASDRNSILTMNSCSNLLVDDHQESCKYFRELQDRFLRYE